MKGCARSCLTGLIGLFVVVAGLHLWFRSLGLAHEVPGPESVVPGFLATIGISFIWSVRDALRDRRLLRDALAGVPPVDGKWAAISGTIRSSLPLTSPIWGASAVAFRYRISQSEPFGEDTKLLAYCEGTGLAPSTISTNLGTFKLLAVPHFEGPGSRVRSEQVVRNAAPYIASTTFETRETAKDRTTSLEKEWTDDDGVFRRDRKSTTPITDLAACDFEEHVISQGEKVCVLGLYSQARGGFVPDPNWAPQTQVIRGDGEAGIELLGARARRYFIGGLVLGGIAAGICYAVVSGAWKP